MLTDNREIINLLLRRGWTDHGCGSDDELHSNRWCECLSEGRRDKTSYNIIDWGCGYARFLLHIMKEGKVNTRYFGFELRGKTHGELLIDFCRENYSHLDTKEGSSIKFGYVDNEELVKEAKNNCTTMLLGSVFTHLSLESSKAILKRFDDFIINGGEIVFSLILSADNVDNQVTPGVYENPDCFAVVYYSHDSLNALTLDNRYKIEHVSEFQTDHTLKHDIFRLTIN